MIDYSRFLVEAFAGLPKEPVFRTGNDTWDFWLTSALYVLISASFCEVFKTFFCRCLARRNADHVRWRVVYGYAGFALTTFVIVNILRWEHRRLKLFGAHQTSLKAERIVRTPSWARLEELLEMKGEDRSLGLFAQTYGKLPEEGLGSVPWLPVYWSRETSVWDYFKLLVGSARTSYWTRQWYMGFLAWSLYICLKSTTHKLGTWFLLSMIILAYHFSLAAAQALFEAVLLIGPSEKSRHFKRGFVKADIIMCVVAVQAIMLEAVPWALAKLDEADLTSRPSWQSSFVGYQGVLLLCSMVLPVISSFGRLLQTTTNAGVLRIDRISIHDTRWSWASIAVPSLLLHIHSIWQCLEDAEPGRLWRWTQMTFILQPWHGAKLETFKNAVYQVFGLLGDHHWISALAWDVIFSALAVGITAFVSSLHVKDMLQCSLLPWWDDAVIAVDQVSDVVQNTAGVGVSRAKKVLDRAQTASRLGLLDVASAGLAKGQQLAAKSDVDLADTMESKLGHFKDLVGAQFDGIENAEESSSREARSPGRRRASRSRSSQAQTDEVADVLPRKSNRNRGSRSTNVRPSSGKETAEDGMHQVVHPLHSAEDALNVAEQGGLVYALFVFGGLGLVSSAVFGAAVLQ